MNTFIQQSFAIAKSECLRMATSPAWAILLFLWTLVCGLFFQIVINYAAANALPVGETPMSYFFRTAPFLLPLLLIIFIPQLTMDVVAGRRERGRMEHLLISGLKPSALIFGAYLAISCLLLLLIIPPIIFHCIVGIHANPDFGKTTSALAALLFIGSSIAALGLSISCWAPNRLAASLISVSIGITWWIIDVFGQQIDQGDNWESWRAALALALTVYDSASGLVEPRLFIGFSLLTVCLLYVARCGLDWQRFPRSRICSAVMGLIIGISCIAHIQSWDRRWDFTSYQTHSLSDGTAALAHTLINHGGVNVTLSSTPAIRSNPLDGPIYERCLNIFKRLRIDGLNFNEMDPALDPNAAVQLSRECDIRDENWKRPLIIIRHLNQHIVLKADELAVFKRQEGRTVLQALRCEGAFLSALQYLKEGHHKQIAWLLNKDVRPLETKVLHQRDRSLQSAYQRLKSDGYNIHSIQNISDANKEHHLLIIPGLRKDFSVAECGYLLDLLRQGTSILLLIDGQDYQTFKQQRSGFLSDLGMDLYQGIGASIDNDKRANVSLPCHFSDTPGPFRILQKDNKQFLAVFAQPMRIGQSKDTNFRSSGYIHYKDSLQLVKQESLNRIDDAVHFCAIAEGVNKEYGHLGVFSSIDSFSDAHIHKATNSLSLSLSVKHLLRRPIVDTLAPRSVQAHRFELSTAQKLILIWCVGVGLPLLSAGVGGFIAWRRRRV